MIYEVSGLSFAYPKRPFLFRNVSFTVREGEIVTLLGKNGAGKSTLMACLLGKQAPAEGEIRLGGKALSGLTNRQIAREIGYVPQSEPGVFGFTVSDYVLMGCACNIGLFSRPGKKERLLADEALDRMGISALAGRPFSELSGGEQQQCTIARAVIRKPKAVLLDEPMSHLDIQNQVRVLRMIRELSGDGYAVMVTTHNPDHALILGGSALLFEDGGQITAGAVSDVVTGERLRRLYGNDLRLRYDEESQRTVCFCPGL